MLKKILLLILVIFLLVSISYAQSATGTIAKSCKTFQDMLRDEVIKDLLSKVLASKGIDMNVFLKQPVEKRNLLFEDLRKKKIVSLIKQVKDDASSLKGLILASMDYELDDYVIKQFFYVLKTSTLTFEEKQDVINYLEKQLENSLINNNLLTIFYQKKTETLESLERAITVSTLTEADRPKEEYLAEYIQREFQNILKIHEGEFKQVIPLIQAVLGGSVEIREITSFTGEERIRPLSSTDFQNVERLEAIIRRIKNLINPEKKEKGLELELVINNERISKKKQGEIDRNYKERLKRTLESLYELYFKFANINRLMNYLDNNYLLPNHLYAVGTTEEIEASKFVSDVRKNLYYNLVQDLIKTAGTTVLSESKQAEIFENFYSDMREQFSRLSSEKSQQYLKKISDMKNNLQSLIEEVNNKKELVNELLQIQTLSEEQKQKLTVAKEELENALVKAKTRIIDLFGGTIIIGRELNYKNFLRETQKRIKQLEKLEELIMGVEAGCGSSAAKCIIKFYFYNANAEEYKKVLENAAKDYLINKVAVEGEITALTSTGEQTKKPVSQVGELVTVIVEDSKTIRIETLVDGNLKDKDNNLIRDGLKSLILTKLSKTIVKAEIVKTPLEKELAEGVQEKIQKLIEEAKTEEYPPGLRMEEARMAALVKEIVREILENKDLEEEYLEKDEILLEKLRKYDFPAEDLLLVREHIRESLELEKRKTLIRESLELEGRKTMLEKLIEYFKGILERLSKERSLEERILLADEKLRSVEKDLESFKAIKKIELLLEKTSTKEELTEILKEFLESTKEKTDIILENVNSLEELLDVLGTYPELPKERIKTLEAILGGVKQSLSKPETHLIQLSSVNVDLKKLNDRSGSHAEADKVKNNIYKQLARFYNYDYIGAFQKLIAWVRITENVAPKGAPSRVYKGEGYEVYVYEVVPSTEELEKLNKELLSLENEKGLGNFLTGMRKNYIVKTNGNVPEQVLDEVVNDLYRALTVARHYQKEKVSAPTDKEINKKIEDYYRKYREAAEEGDTQKMEEIARSLAELLDSFSLTYDGSILSIEQTKKELSDLIQNIKNLRKKLETVSEEEKLSLLLDLSYYVTRLGNLERKIRRKATGHQKFYSAITGKPFKGVVEARALRLLNLMKRNPEIVLSAYFGNSDVHDMGKGNIESNIQFIKNFLLSKKLEGKTLIETINELRKRIGDERDIKMNMYLLYMGHPAVLNEKVLLNKKVFTDEMIEQLKSFLSINYWESSLVKSLIMKLEINDRKGMSEVLALLFNKLTEAVGVGGDETLELQEIKNSDELIAVRNFLIKTLTNNEIIPGTGLVRLGLTENTAGTLEDANDLSEQAALITKVFKKFPEDYREKYAYVLGELLGKKKGRLHDELSEKVLSYFEKETNELIDLLEEVNGDLSKLSGENFKRLQKLLPHFKNVEVWVLALGKGSNAQKMLNLKKELYKVLDKYNIAESLGVEEAQLREAVIQEDEDKFLGKPISELTDHLEQGKRIGSGVCN